MFTGQLGTPDSLLGQIVLAGVGTTTTLTIPDTHPALGGVYDQTATGGVLPKLRSGRLIATLRSGRYDQTTTGGEVL